MFNFPNNPTVGDTVLNNNQTYVWDGIVWSTSQSFVTYVPTASFINPLTGSFQARKANQNYGAGVNLIVWDIIDVNNLSTINYNSGVFTNTSGTTKKFLFQMMSSVAPSSTTLLFANDANIFFTLNGVDNKSNRFGFQSKISATDVDNGTIYGGILATININSVMNTQYMFVLNPGETVRCYFSSPYSLQLSSGNGTAPGFSTGTNLNNLSTNFTTRISVLEYI